MRRRLQPYSRRVRVVEGRFEVNLTQGQCLQSEISKSLDLGTWRFVPNGISSGGIFFNVRNRCDIVCAAVCLSPFYGHNLPPRSGSLAVSTGRDYALITYHCVLPSVTTSTEAVVWSCSKAYRHWLPHDR